MLLKPIARAGDYVLYWLLRFVLKTNRSNKRHQVENCTIYAPADKLDVILHGLNFLKTIDETMYRRIVGGPKLICDYSPTAYNCLFNSFGITDDFLSWGDRGIALCFVQSSALIDEQGRTNARCDAPVGASSRALARTYDWLSRHQFPEELSGRYRAYLTLLEGY